VGLLLKMLNSEPLHDSCSSLTTGDTDDIDLLVLVEHLIDVDGLLEEVMSELNLLVD
jgi:hypothetical protein